MVFVLRGFKFSEVGGLFYLLVKFRAYFCDVLVVLEKLSF